jgi:hypothetical protein
MDGDGLKWMANDCDGLSWNELEQVEQSCNIQQGYNDTDISSLSSTSSHSTSNSLANL